MHSRLRAALVAIVVAVALGACNGRGGSPLGTEYEYEEDLTLSLDGSATLVVNASIPALVTLRGLNLPTELQTRGDQLKDQVRASYASDQTRVGRIGTWTRRGRRFVGVHITIADIRKLDQVVPLAWSRYELREEGDQVVFRHKLWASQRPATLPINGLTGEELVAFRLHLPSRIRFQNSRWLDQDGSRPAARGNILTWEQRLKDRLKAQPIAYAEDKTPDVMEAKMDRESILYRTLWLFGIAFAAALLVLAGLIWLTMRRGATTDPSGPAPSSHPH